MAAPKNAIARRLDRLHDQWNEFASDEEARVLRWMIRADELRVIEVFIQTEQDDSAGEIPDLFITLTDPFEDVVSYGETLRASLLAQYEEARPELREDGIDDDWSPPPPEGRHTLTAFIDTCASLRDRYADVTERLAVFLMPAAVKDNAEWQRWLGAVSQRLPREVRVAVVDSVESPVLAGLAEANPARVRTIEAGLDMAAATMELARGGGVATPDGQFRVQFAALAQALEKGDLAAARSRADAAGAIAQTNGWGQLVAAVHLAFAGGLLSAGEWSEALSRYFSADAAGAQLEAQGDNMGSKLRLNAHLGRAATIFAAQDYAKAAAAYEDATRVATTAGDPLMLMESWRMAAHCHEQAGDALAAWECGLNALDASETMSPDSRRHSTLPFVGEGLLRVAGAASGDARTVDQRLTELVGTPDWRALVAAATGAA
jgi:hypothetical protein